MRILVPLEGTEVEQQVLLHARDLASKNRAEVVLLRVVPLPRQETALLTPWERERVDASHQAVRIMARGALVRTAEKLRATGVNVHTEVVAGEVVEAIVRASRTLCANMIVMSAEGMRAGGPFLNREVTRQVTRQAPVPVVSVGRAAPVPGAPPVSPDFAMPN